MIRLRPDDDYFLCLHSPATPMQIGALLLFDTTGGDGRPLGSERFASDVRRHLTARLPATELLRVRRSTPWHLDGDAWYRLGQVDLDRVVSELRPAAPVARAELHRLVARWVMEPLDPDGPPFRFVIVGPLEGGGAAVYFTILHALADGIGFQSIVAALTDGSSNAAAVTVAGGPDERIPRGPERLARAALALAVDARHRRSGEAARRQAQAALDAFKRDPDHRRAATPRLGLSGPTSAHRSYSTRTIPLDRFSAIARAYGGTVNDAFLAVGGGAVRALLLDIGDLPAEPVVVNAARSYRRPEHGELGNRIVSLHPHLATHLADPAERFAAIRRSMASELERSRLQEPLMDQPARPWAARRLRRQVGARVEGGGAVLPGNVSLSNVPGPAEPRYLAGYRLTASYPTPILGAGRFLNITLRRYVEGLDLGIMTDADKVPDAEVVAAHVEAAIDELLADGAAPARPPV